VPPFYRIKIGWVVSGACPGFFIGGKTEGAKIEAESREEVGILGRGSKPFPTS